MVISRQTLYVVFDWCRQFTVNNFFVGVRLVDPYRPGLCVTGTARVVGAYTHTRLFLLGVLLLPSYLDRVPEGASLYRVRDMPPNPT